MKIKPLVMIMLCLLSQTVAAKIALLIGNDAYDSEFLPALDKAVSDAERLRDKLTELGFKVIFKKDLNAEEMHDAIIEFHDALKKDNEVGLFYYAGHGMQVDGDNFLVPINARIKRKYQAKRKAINADEVLDAMFSAKAKINLIILDACRDNPLVNRGGTRGLAAISREDTFIVYATQPNKVAGDGVFMDYLSVRIMEPLPIDAMIKKVINDVRNKTGGSQVPSYSYNLRNDFYFNGKPNITTPLVVIEPKKVVKPPNITASKSDNSWKTMKHYQVKEGLVKDTKTGLMWMRCSMGQKWNGLTCQGKATEFKWKELLKASTDFKYAGYSDWQLPTIKELNTLLYCSNGKVIQYSEDRYYGIETEGSKGCKSNSRGDYQRPTIHQAVFPNTASGYWSSSYNANNSGYGWGVTFYYGNDIYYHRNDIYYLRLVRGLIGKRKKTSYVNKLIKRRMTDLF